MPTNHENNRIPIGYSNPNRKRKKLRLTSCFKRERKTVGHSYFLQWQEKRQLKLQQTSKSNQRRRKTYEAHRAGLVPPCADTSTQNPKENNILLIYYQNIAGLSDQSWEEAINLMAETKIIATCLQENWTGDTLDNCGLEDRYNGFLFLLQENKNPENQNGRNRCGIVFILSSLNRRAWIESGHPSEYTT